MNANNGGEYATPLHITVSTGRICTNWWYNWIDVHELQIIPNLFSDFEKSVQLLLKRGAKRDIKNDREETALQIAKKRTANDPTVRQRIINLLEMCYKI